MEEGRARGGETRLGRAGLKKGRNAVESTWTEEYSSGGWMGRSWGRKGKGRKGEEGEFAPCPEE